MVERGMSRRGLISRRRRSGRRTSVEDDIMRVVKETLNHTGTFSKAGKIADALGAAAHLTSESKSKKSRKKVPFYAESKEDKEFLQLTTQGGGSRRRWKRRYPTDQSFDDDTDEEYQQSELTHNYQKSSAKDGSSGTQLRLARSDSMTVITNDGEILPLDKVQSFWRQGYLKGYLGDGFADKYLGRGDDGTDFGDDKDKMAKDDAALEEEEKEHLSKSEEDTSEETLKRNQSWSFKTVPRDVLSSSMRRTFADTTDIPHVGQYRPRYSLIERRVTADYTYRPHTSPILKKSAPDQKHQPTSESARRNASNIGSISSNTVTEDTKAKQDSVKSNNGGKASDPHKNKKLTHSSYGLLKDGNVSSSDRFRDWLTRRTIPEDYVKPMHPFVSTSREKLSKLDCIGRTNLDPGEYWPQANRTILEPRRESMVEMNRQIDRDKLNPGRSLGPSAIDLVYDVNLNPTRENLGKGKHRFDQFCDRAQQRLTTRTGITIAQNDADSKIQNRYPVFHRFYDVEVDQTSRSGGKILSLDKTLPRERSGNYMHPKFYVNSGLKSNAPKEDSIMQKRESLVGGSEVISSRWMSQHGLLSTQRRPAFLVHMNKQTSRRELYDKKSVHPNLEYDTAEYENIRYPRMPSVNLSKYSGRKPLGRDPREGVPPGAYMIKESLVTRRVPQVDFTKTQGRKN